MVHACSRLGVSERRACRVLGQARSTQRHRPKVRADEPRLVARIVELAKRYGRYGYRRITALLRAEGWRVNAKRVERIWRQEGLKVDQAKKLKELEKENSRLKRLLAEAELDKAILKEAASGNF